MQNPPSPPSNPPSDLTQPSQLSHHSAPQSQVSIDTHLLQKKKQLLQQFYTQSQDSNRLQIIKKWPNEQIQQVCSKGQIIHKTNNGWYIGSLCNQMFHGYGLLIYKLGATVNGIASDVQASGRDTQDKAQFSLSKIGRFYQGEFQNNCKHGYGFEYIAGDIYIGKFINNKPEDINGIFLWKNGDLYMGGFINGMKHGVGRWESGKDYYEGTWKLNRPQGNGKIHTSNSQYQGSIKNGFKHGFGLQIFSNGDQYNGLYANGKPQGDGVYNWKNGAVYKGQFKNGIRYGFGSWVFGNQSYEGYYVNDKRNGEGKYTWGSDSYYKGQFLDDLRHGIGQMFWGDKSMYRGEWREGVQCGMGQTWQDGVLVSKGMYEDGKFVKQPNKLQNSNATQSNQSNSHSQGYTKPSKIAQKTMLSMDYRPPKKSSQQKNSTRYPVIQRKDRAHSHNNKSNRHGYHLSQIDEFPKVQKDRRKKYAVSTSFSNHTKNSGLSNNTHNSFENNLARQTVKYSDQEDRLHKFAKFHQNEMEETPKHLISKEKKMVHINSKRALYEKKKMHGIVKTATKPIGVVNQMGNTELGPIKWKNFTHMKNNTAQFGHNAPNF